jgi:septum formation protein
VIKKNQADERPRLLLASTSPRRFNLLAEAGVPFDVVAPRDVAEDIPAGEDPAALVQRHALAKARSVAAVQGGRIILGADTVVVHDGVTYGKPTGAAAARAMLAALQGRGHTVYTGLALLPPGGGELTGAEATDVVIRPLSDEEIDVYVASGEPLDKAGGYAIQGKGAFLVERVDGDYFNVVGLPLYRLSLLLARLGYEVFR